ncbi:PREDICTED: probable calcium-binding protein CML48 [Tarenaya hassleriana]|uniref:probable calcium-binding protein CML48 n=1 Tax=Tarenaya hassleriana TaxID=28532 RepID=UPI00053C94AA|nr:PREDICTED: probable calcium-binding protein CML48 [Tarenaya hassleriana]
MSHSNQYVPSAPEMPESYKQQFSGGDRYGYAYSGGGWGQAPPQHQYSATFPPGTHPDVVRSFEGGDRNRSGFLEETELRQALSFSGYGGLSARTIRLLMFIYKSPGDPLLRLGHKEYANLWTSLGQWRAIFERYDRDRSGKMDSTELKDALYHLGYMLPSSVLQLIITQYDDGRGQRVELCFDSFLECGMIVKGLTEKFKEKDPGYKGSATLSYDDFMCMVVPFIASYD